MTFPTLTVEDILRRPHFKDAKIVAGMDGIQRLVSWVHIVEVAKIGHLLNGGELILSTGVGWASNQHTRMSFLQQLIDCQVSALCVELGEYLSEIPSDMIELADKHHLPIIVFPKEVRFVDITQDLLTVLYEQERAKQQEGEWIQKWLKGTLGERQIKKYLEQTNCTPMPSGGVVCIMNVNQHFSEFVHFAIRSRFIFNQLDFHLLSVVEQKKLIFILLNYGARQNWKKRVCDSLHTFKQLTKNFALFPVCFGNYVSKLTLIAESFENALEAMNIAQRLKGKDYVFFDELHIWRIVSTAEQSGKLSSFVRDYLQPILDLDEEQRTVLLQTLKTFLACNGSKQETANRLFIVRQTLYHRLQKIEELMGEDFLFVPEKRLALEFALYAYDFLQHNGK